MRVNTKEIGARIREQRRVLAFTQAELAERVGLDSIYISQIERGQRTMSIPALFRIADVLKVRPGFLLDGETKESKQDPLVLEVREVLARLNDKQIRAVIKALRALNEK